MAHIQTSEPGSHVRDEVEDFQKAVDDFILLVKTLNTGSTLEENFDLIKQINSKEIKSAVTSKTFERSGSKNLPNQQMISGRNVHEESRPEMWGISDQVISTSRDTVCITPDSQTFASSISDEVESYQSHSTVVSPEYLNVEKPYLQKQSMQKINVLDKERNLNFTENTAYTRNDSEQENADGKIADSENLKAKGLFSVGRADAACEDINQSQSCIEKIKNGSPLKLQTIEIEQECNNMSRNMIFQMSYYTTEFYCAVCKVSYSEIGSHDGNQTCDVCKKIFDCKVQLEDHYFIHEKLHETICRICHFEINKHKTTEVKKYQCCACGYTYDKKSCLKRHLYSHSPLKLFKCELCGLRFKRILCTRNHFTKIHPLCIICGKRFVDNNSLVEHRLEQHRYAYIRRLHENAP